MSDLLPLETWKQKLLGKRMVTREPPRPIPRDGPIFYYALEPQLEPLSGSDLTSSSLMPASPKLSLLLNLPADLRLQILEEVLTPLTSAVMFTCRQLYEECQPIAQRKCYVYEEELYQPGVHNVEFGDNCNIFCFFKRSR
ncbi:hypothetical protein MMC13_007821 [Lambiella insularis]|nr:hypothetical protein [Lambiella insularis]